MEVRPGHEWDKFEGLPSPAARAAGVSRPRAVRRGRQPPAQGAAPSPVPDDAAGARCQPTMSTQAGFGALLNEIGRSDGEFAQRIVTTSPDVTVSTNLGAWVNRRGLFAREAMADTFKSERIPSTFNWDFSPHRPAHRARHRRDEPVHPALGARPLAHHQRRAAAADRHALRSLHRARARCAELCLLPGCALHPGGDAVRHHAGAGRRRASVDRRSR